jgi:hypothetical protein
MMERVWFAAAARKDGSQPKLVKAMNNVFFLNEEDAQVLAEELSIVWGVKLSVFSAYVTDTNLEEK